MYLNSQMLWPPVSNLLNASSLLDPDGNWHRRGEAILLLTFGSISTHHNLTVARGNNLQARAEEGGASCHAGLWDWNPQPLMTTVPTPVCLGSRDSSTLGYWCYFWVYGFIAAFTLTSVITPLGQQPLPFHLLLFVLPLSATVLMASAPCTIIKVGGWTLYKSVVWSTSPYPHPTLVTASWFPTTLVQPLTSFSNSASQPFCQVLLSLRDIPITRDITLQSHYQYSLLGVTNSA